MSLWRIAWRSIQQRGLASALTALSMAMGVTLVVAVLSIHGIIADSFKTNTSLGYNMIVGAKGGKLQLTLNTVFYLSAPIENIPYDYYLEFHRRERRAEEYRHSLLPREAEAGRDGKYAAFVATAIPVCLGDYYGRFRVVGTTPAMFERLRYGPELEKQYRFAKGQNFEQDDYFAAVVGATVAREKGIDVGHEISPAHGDPEGIGHAEKFRVVGILAPTGTPNDRGVFVNIEGFYLMEGHAKPIEDEAAGAGEAVQEAPVHEHADHWDDGHYQPLPIEQREVTAVLVRTSSPIFAVGLPNTINEGPVAQCVMPIREITSLFDIIVRPIQLVLLVLTAMICVVSGISILVSIYNSMSERRREIAIMRALGAGRGTVMTIILLESIILSLGGGGIGWFLGHTLNAAASPWIERETGVSIGWKLAPPINLVEFMGWEAQAWVERWANLPTELLLVPSLLLLAVIVGFLPALSAYRTDVSKSLSG